MKVTLDQIRTQIMQKPLTRQLAVDRETINQDDYTVELSASSEYPVERWFGYEILDHKKGSIRMGRMEDGASVLDTHFGDQVGVVMNVNLDEKSKKLRALLKFSKNTARAVEIFKDIVDGIRKNVSIRYQVHQIVFESETDDVATYRATDWEPIHIAMEPDPADPTVGVGRSKDDNPEIIPLDLSGDVAEQIEKFNRANDGKIKILINQNRSTSTMPEPNENNGLDTALDSELRRRDSIDKLATDFQRNVPGIDLAKESRSFKDDRSKTVADFQDFILRKMRDPEAIRTADTNLGMGKKEVRDYSLRNIILYQLGKIPAKDVAVELEASRTLADKLNKQPKGILVPDDIMRRRRELNVNRMSSQERDLIVGTPGSGGYLVKDQYIDQSFIEMLENAMVTKAAGVQVINGLVGNIPMIRELDSYSTYWVGEGSGPTKSNITFSQETMSPKKGGALAKFSYEFLTQSSIAAEAYVEKRLAIACALQADRATLYGTGSDAQPKGLKNWTGIGAVAGAGFTRSKALEMEGQIMTANAAELGSMKFLSRGSVRSALKDKEISAGTARFLVGDDNKMIGYDYSLVSNQFDAGDLAFGIWSQLLLGYWNEVEILANPFDSTTFPAGDVLVRALQALDTFVLNPGAFSFSTGVN